MQRTIWGVMLALACVFALGARPAAAQDYKGFGKGYCTCYAAQEFDKNAPGPKTNWRGNAGQWLANAEKEGWKVVKGDAKGARTGAIIVWSGGGFGHVGIVREIKGNSIRIDEMNWGTLTDVKNGKTVNFDKVTSATLPFSDLSRGKSYRFLGYILPERR